MERNVAAVMLQLSPDGWCLVVLEEANAWKGYDLSEG